MPRRLPMRPAKIIGNMFVLLVICVIGLIYYTQVFLIWGPKAIQESDNGRITTYDPWVLVLLSVFHVFFIMLVWSFVQAMTTDPGQVPVFWGFHLGDPENKRRRYCLMCNIFKPERCHHCSACNRCVLNMDHHCPWINNCIGFWNRKFFILLLIYVLIITYFNILTMFTAWFDSITWAVDVYYYTKTKNDENIMEKNLILQFAFVMNGIIAVLMTMFLKFHIKLALNNKTTIENLEMKNKTYQSLYDIGPKRNWEQVFGINKLLWPFPVFWRSGKPLGDGIYWPTNRNEGKDPNADSANRNSAGRRQNSVGSPHQNGSFSQPQKKQFGGQMGQNPNAQSQAFNANQQFNQMGNSNMGGIMGQGNYNNRSQQMQNTRQYYNPQQQQQYQPQQQFNQSLGSAPSQVVHPNQRFAQQQQMAQSQQFQRQRYGGGQPHYAAQVGSSLEVSSVIMENRQRAAQLSQQINKQKASQQAKPKNSRAPGNSSSSGIGPSGGAKQAPAKRQRGSGGSNSSSQRNLQAPSRS